MIRNRNKCLHFLLKRNLALLTCLLLSLQVLAHGDLSVRIENKTQEILKEPDNFKLYHERGMLYQQHIEYDKAIDDYLKSETLGNTQKVLKYHMAEVYYLTENYSEALTHITTCLDKENTDVKSKKLEAQILFNLKAYKQSLVAYQYVMNTMEDLRPEDIIEYTDIILAENNKNYDDALKAIEFGLKQLGANTLSLQLKKLDYLKASNALEQAIQQYDYFILEYTRKEFWYFKKAQYLVEHNKNQEAIISLKLASMSIQQLDAKFKNMASILELKEDIKNLEESIN
ncbi:tetratricopeptide repeat protein [Formosa sp. 3Alg 14/1]|uniref:tetratricopeptide repeat protein n=1 Tax=Formosa sp. 3Alg 14/1 TaxID=3382190 RepID=UPI0039BE5667